MEPWWNDTERGKPKYSDKTLYQCHFIHHKSQKDWPGLEPGLLRTATNCLSHGMASTSKINLHHSLYKDAVCTAQ